MGLVSLQLSQFREREREREASPLLDLHPDHREEDLEVQDGFPRLQEDVDLAG